MTKCPSENWVSATRQEENGGWHLTEENERGKEMSRRGEIYFVQVGTKRGTSHLVPAVFLGEQLRGGSLRWHLRQQTKCRWALHMESEAWMSSLPCWEAAPHGMREPSSFSGSVSVTAG